MIRSIISRWIFPAITILLCAPFLLQAAEQARTPKPVFLYSRYFNAPGETRYLPDGGYREILRQLRGHFEVQFHDRPLTPESLRGVAVVLIANPSDQAVSNGPAPHHVDLNDAKILSRYVESGGGLIVMGNQENHNLEIKDLNRLLAHFGLQFTNLYTDVKLLPLPAALPILGGLRWAYYTGNQVAIEEKHSAHPRALVENDLKVRLMNGTRDTPGALLAVAEPGRGRVAVVTDAGWITDDALMGKEVGGVVIPEHDNLEIFRRLTRWVGHQK